MSLKTRCVLTCDEPNCDETQPVLLPYYGPGAIHRDSVAGQAPGWTLPEIGEESGAKTFCPRHRPVAQ